MAFLSAGFLFALPLIAVPVMIHLLNRRQKQVIRWGAMQFLLESATRRRRFWRIDDLIVMLLRATAILLAVLALSQPLLRSRWLGDVTGRDVTLILDPSLSTSRRSDSGVMLDRIKDRAQHLIRELRKGDTVRILLALGSPKWLTPVAVQVDADSQAQMQAAIAALQPTQATANLPAAVEAALEAEPAASSRSRNVIVLTDHCAYGWHSDAVPKWNAIRKILESADPQTSLSVVDWPLENRPVNNLAVDRIEVSRGVVGIDETFLLSADIRNLSRVSSGPGVLNWAVEGVPAGVSSVSPLEPGETSRVRIQHSLGAPGAYQIQCQLDSSDEAKLDDAATTIVEAVDRVPILIVRPPEGSVAEIQYLLAALGRPPDASPVEDLRQSVFAPTLVETENLAGIDLPAFHAVLLLSAEGIPGPTYKRLVDYVTAGGGLWIAVDDRTLVGAFNAVFYDEGRGLCPLPLGEPVGNAANRDEFVLVSPPSGDHGPMRMLADTQRLDIDKLHIHRHMPFVKGGADRDPRVLLETEHGKILAIESQAGNGRAIFLGMPLDLSWSNFPLCQSYVALVHEWLWYLTEPSATRRNILPGTSIQLRIPTAAAGRVENSNRALARESGASHAIVTTPQGDKFTLDPSEDAVSRTFIFQDTHLPGSYVISIAEAEPDGDGSITSPFHAQRDPQESDFEPLTAAQREALTAMSGIRFVSPSWSGQIIGSHRAATAPIAGHLLLALLLVLVGELSLTGWSAWRRFAAPASRSPIAPR